tara:strand:- start:674 stop:1285 length:612 start_codon:yes stop_codon:yes gene_type:complete
MKLNENQRRILEQAAENALPKSGKLRKLANQNPNFKKLQSEVAKQPLVPPAQMKNFMRGMAVMNNPKAFNGMLKKGNVYENPKDRRDVVTFLTNGMQVFTKGLAGASAALTIAGGDQAKNELAKGLSEGRLNEQQAPEAEAAIKMINKAQKNAAAYLMANQVGANDVKNLTMNAPHDDGKVTSEQRIREVIRRKVEKLVKGKK